MSKKYQKELYDARASYNKWIKKLESQGFTINEDLKKLPSIPKKITPGSVSKVKKQIEKLKQTATIEIDGKKLDYKHFMQHQKNAPLREKVQRRREEFLVKKAAADAEKDRRYQTPAPDYSDIPDYNDPNAIPEAPEEFEPDIPTELELRKYVDYVFDKFIEDIYNMVDELESRGLSPKKKEAMKKAAAELNSWANRCKAQDTENAYRFAKAIEKSKYNGTYINESIMYHKDTAREWIMELESYVDGIDIPDKVQDAFDDMSDAASNAGYDSYTSEDADEDEEFMNEFYNDGSDDFFDF